MSLFTLITGFLLTSQIYPKCWWHWYLLQLHVRLAAGLMWAVVDTVLSSCVFSELPCLLEKKLHFRQQQNQCQHKISSPAPVASWSLQGVLRKDSSNSVWSFKSFWSKSCWTAWFRCLLIITQYIFFTAAGRESLHIWADSPDMGSTFRSLIFHGSWEQHCPLWELFSRVWLSSFPHGGWHCKGKRMLLDSINIFTHICVLTCSPLCSAFLSGAQRELVALCWSPACWCSLPLFVPGGLSLTLSALHALSSICTVE